MLFGHGYNCEDCESNIYDRHREFMAAFHDGVPTSPQLDENNEKLVLLYKKLVEEESQELRDALENYYKGKKKKNDVKALNSIASEAVDLLYVTLGLLDSIGVKGEDLFTEIHKANMAKVRKDGKVKRCKKTGKVLKPKGWKKANTAQVIKKQMS